MVKKSSASKKKSNSFLGQIEKIEACIHQDSIQLEKAYPKALAALEKELIHVSKEQKKVKATAKTAKKGKAGKVDAAALDKQLAALKAEKDALNLGYKKLKAGKKVCQQFEKAWAKQLKKTKGAKKAVRKTPVKAKAVNPDWNADM